MAVIEELYFALLYFMQRQKKMYQREGAKLNDVSVATKYT